MIVSRYIRSSVAILAGSLLFACDDAQEPDAVVHVVEVTPLVSAVKVGDSIALSAVAKGPDGTARTDVTVTWEARQPELITVVGSGRNAIAVARRAGIAEINAKALEKIGVATFEIRNPAPVPQSLTPASIQAGAPAFTLTVRGASFVDGAIVEWNGAARATEFVSATELRATIPAADVAQAGEVQVRVVNPAPVAGPSQPLTFSIATGGVAYVELSTGEAKIREGETVQLTATARDVFGRALNETITWTSNATDVAAVSDEGVVTAGRYGIAVITARAGGQSASALITVDPRPAAMPRITSISPDSVSSNPNSLQITIRGEGFIESSHVFFGDEGRPMEYISPTELRLLLWDGDVRTSNSTRNISVLNYGTGRSNNVPFRVTQGVWSVRLTSTSTSPYLWPGDEMQFTAAAYDEQDRPVVGRPVTWRITDANVASVTNGRVVARAPGRAFIEAHIDNRYSISPGYVHVRETLPYDLLYQGTQSGTSELWLLAIAPNAEPRRVLPIGTYATDPAAAPNGARIAYVGFGSNGYRNIFVVNRDGTNAQQLTFTQELNDQPAWSADGTKIAFRGVRNGVSDIYVMNADGTALTNVTNNVARTDGVYAVERPTWRHDGRVVFSFGYANLNPRPYRLYSALPDGTDVGPLTSTSEFFEHEPAVSPNGDYIAVRRTSQHGEFIDVIGADGSQYGWPNLPGPGRTPSWSPDQRFVVYARSTGSGNAIYMTALGDAEGVPLVANGFKPVFLRR